MATSIQAMKKKQLELKKHVSTIHCANALSLLQRKIANALLFHAYDDLLKQDEYQISIRELCHLIGYESHDYKTIKKALVDLLSTVVEWNIIEEDSAISQEQWNASSIIADASIKGSTCTYSYSNKMKQLLYTPAVYGRLNMLVQSKFKSSYGLALYENTVRYQNLPFTPWFDILTFRRLMGVDQDKYLVFRDFKRRVLDKAVSEVNDYSNLLITPELKKQQRQVVAIRFQLDTKKTDLKDNILAQDISIFAFLENYGFTKSQSKELLELYSSDYIMEKIKLIEASNTYKQGQIINLANYLKKALKEDYRPPRACKTLLAEKQKQTLQQEEKQRYQLQQQEKQKRNYTKYLDKVFKDFMENISETERQFVDNQFKNYLTAKDSSFLTHLYHKEGLKSRFVEMEFRRFLRQDYPEQFASILSFEAYCQTEQL